MKRALDTVEEPQSKKLITSAREFEDSEWNIFHENVASRIPNVKKLRVTGIPYLLPSTYITIPDPSHLLVCKSWHKILKPVLVTARVRFLDVKIKVLAEMSERQIRYPTRLGFPKWSQDLAMQIIGHYDRTEIKIHELVQRLYLLPASLRSSITLISTENLQEVLESSRPRDLKKACLSLRLNHPAELARYNYDIAIIEKVDYDLLVDVFNEEPLSFIADQYLTWFLLDPRFSQDLQLQLRCLNRLGRLQHRCYYQGLIYPNTAHPVQFLVGCLKLSEDFEFFGDAFCRLYELHRDEFEEVDWKDVYECVEGYHTNIALVYDRIETVPECCAIFDEGLFDEEMLIELFNMGYQEGLIAYLKASLAKQEREAGPQDPLLLEVKSRRRVMLLLEEELWTI
jgi:hypothetical protein